jgi:hypothetical protein
VPPCACNPDDRDWSLNRTPFSLRVEGGSSRIVGAAMDDREVRSIDVRGRRLLLREELPASSALVLLATCGCAPSLLLGRYNIESLPPEVPGPLLGVTLPSMKEDCDALLA